MKAIVGAIIAILLISSIWISGCVGGNTQANTSINNGNQINKTQSNEQQQTNENQQTSEQNEQSNEQNEQNQGQTMDISMETLAEIMAMGKSIHCVGTSTYQGETGTVNIYVKGNLYRYSGESSYGDKMDVIVDYDKNMMYVKLYGDNDLAAQFDCDWLSLKIEEQSEAGTNFETDTDTEIAEITDPSGAKVTWKCNIEDIPSTYFQPDGKVCNLEDIFQQYMNGKYGEHEG